MKKEFEVQEVGKLVVDFNFFSGGYKVYLNNELLPKVSKSSFSFTYQEKEERVYIGGNPFSGIDVRILNESFMFLEKMVWYQYILALIPIVMCLIIGNVPALAQNGFYFVGGAIGGAIGGLCTALSLYTNYYSNKWYIRLLLQILFIAAAFLICFGIGNAIVAGMKK